MWHDAATCDGSMTHHQQQLQDATHQGSMSLRNDATIQYSNSRQQLDTATPRHNGNN
jgi:hypothetical protein